MSTAAERVRHCLLYTRNLGYGNLNADTRRAKLEAEYGSAPQFVHTLRFVGYAHYLAYFVQYGAMNTTCTVSRFVKSRHDDCTLHN